MIVRLCTPYSNGRMPQELVLVVTLYRATIFRSAKIARVPSFEVLTGSLQLIMYFLLQTLSLRGGLSLHAFISCSHLVFSKTPPVPKRYNLLLNSSVHIGVSWLTRRTKHLVNLQTLRHHAPTVHLASEGLSSPTDWLLLLFGLSPMTHVVASSQVQCLWRDCASCTMIMG
jgi:hypothetical protein